jgi:RNA polymerase sigma factor (sigma-70 family)
MTEAEAIRLAQQGDASAFEHIYRLHSRRVYALCLRMVGNPAEAEDLTQDAFLQLFRKIGTFRGESAFSTWLHRLSVNVVLMKLRKKTLPETSLEESTDPEDEVNGPRREIGGPDLMLTGSIDRVHLERDCRADGLLDREFQVPVAQGADALAGTFTGNAAGYSAAGTASGQGRRFGLIVACLKLWVFCNSEIKTCFRSLGGRGCFEVEIGY